METRRGFGFISNCITSQKQKKIKWEFSSSLLSSKRIKQFLLLPSSKCTTALLPPHVSQFWSSLLDFECMAALFHHQAILICRATLQLHHLTSGDKQPHRCCTTLLLQLYHHLAYGSSTASAIPNHMNQYAKHTILQYNVWLFTLYYKANVI